MLKKRKDGTTYYYYYKKKRGRHKKPGRKKTPKKRGRSWQEKWDFKIVKCTFNKQDEFIGVFHDLQEVEEAKKILEAENSKVILPRKYTSSSRLASSNKNNSAEYVSEYLVLKRIRTEEDKLSVTQLRDEYGRLVEHKTNSERWNIYGKFPYSVEEKFWVYGYNPLSDRKTCMWIYENLIYGEFQRNGQLVIQVNIYKNKVIFTYDAKRIRFTICKNQSDAIRLYNKLNDITKKNKIRHIYFMGEILTCTRKGRLLVKDLAELTGWAPQKIRSKYT